MLSLTQVFAARNLEFDTASQTSKFTGGQAKYAPNQCKPNEQSHCSTRPHCRWLSVAVWPSLLGRRPMVRRRSKQHHVLLSVSEMRSWTYSTVCFGHEAKLLGGTDGSDSNLLKVLPLPCRCSLLHNHIFCAFCYPQKQMALAESFFKPEKVVQIPTKDLLSWIFDDQRYDQDAPVCRIYCCAG